MTRHIISSILLLTISFGISAVAQDGNSTNTAREIIREIVKEKVHEANEIQGQYSHPGYRKLMTDSFTETQVSFEPESESEVHAAINPTDSNNIVVSPIHLTLNPGYLETLVPIYYTHDFGEVWHQSSFNPRYPDTNYIIQGGGDPVFAYDADGKLYFSWIHLYKKSNTNDTILWSMMWAYSNDGGENWSLAYDPFIENSAGTFPYNFDIISDKEWLACDQSGSPFRNNLYIAYFLVNATNNTQQIVVKTKPADSIGFNPEAVTVAGGGSTPIQFAGIGVDTKGVVHVTYYYNKSSLYESHSSDGGKTFSTPVLVTNMHLPLSIHGISGNRIYPSPMMAVDKGYPAHVYITYTADGFYSTQKTRSDIYFSRSEDGGETWDDPIIIHDTSWSDPRDQFYSTLYVNESGVVTVCWYDAKFSSNTAINNEVNYYMAHSFDQGKTFTYPTRVSYAPTNFGTVGKLNSSFGIGEYTQVVSTRGYAIPFWTDGRTNDGNLNIYSAKIPISRYSGIPEIATVKNTAALTNLFFDNNKNTITANVENRGNQPWVIDLVDLQGRMIETLFSGLLPAGKTKLTLKVKSNYDGIYLVRACMGTTYLVRKIILTK